MSVIDTPPVSPTLSLAVLEAEKRRLTRLAKSPGVISNLALAGRYHAEISKLREQIKQAKAGAR